MVAGIFRFSLNHSKSDTTKKMKKLILLIAIACFFTQVQAQKMKHKNVPVLVTDAFTKAYPTIKYVSWTTDGNNYAVDYVENKMDKSITWVIPEI